MGLKEQLKKLKRRIHPSGRVFVLYEGEQVSPSYVDPPHGELVVYLAHSWRPEGEALPEFVEVIPGYERPVNWREIEEKEDQEPGRMELP